MVPVRFLLVDDSEDIRELFVRVARGRSDVACAGVLTSADHLAEEAARSSPDIVIVDLALPGREPTDAIRELRTCMPGCKIVVYTGREDEAATQAALDAGATCVLGKSLTVLELLERAKSIVTSPFIKSP